MVIREPKEEGLDQVEFKSLMVMENLRDERVEQLLPVYELTV